jgi:hypothetical protein
MTDLENLKNTVAHVNQFMQKSINDCADLLYQAGAERIEFHLEKQVVHQLGMKPMTIHTFNVEVKL